MLSNLVLYSLMAKNHAGAFIRRFADDHGQDFIEYALILGVISVVIIAAFTLSPVKGQISNLSQHIACNLQNKTWVEGAVGGTGTCS